MKQLSPIDCRRSHLFAFFAIALCAVSIPLKAQDCPETDAGLSLAPGFCATVFADGIGHARHLVVAPNGVVYVNTWSGRYYGNDVPHTGGFLVALKDTHASGRADQTERFGETKASGGAGGTGIAIYNDSLYVEINDRIVRYALPATGLIPSGAPKTVVSGLPLDGDHPMHPFAIDADGMLYVDLGSATNACQRKNRELESPGVEPCTELETRGGIWRFDANKLDQRFTASQRYATGIRNAVGIAVDPSGHGVYATQHGRDQLSQNWPKLYTAQQGAKWPSEELLRVEQGDNFGWPECYFDPDQNKLVLAPEYGGDGGHAVGACVDRKPPIAVFPAHWAPNAVLIYDGGDFPGRFKNGAFIAFHGSWNRAPFAQGGYNVVFQSLPSNGSSGSCEIFADGFAGANVSPGGAQHRPAGLAVGPDGALYVSDDQRGRIYRITYVGGPGADSAVGTPCPGTDALRVAGGEGAADTSGDDLGRSVFTGAGACAGCHGAAGQGTPLGPNLTDAQWLWGDGSIESITKSIRDGVAAPKQFRSAMPPMGGAQLTDAQISAVAAYVYSLSHATASKLLPAELSIPGERTFPESLTSTSDGTIFIGSMGANRIMRVLPGMSAAQDWIVLDASAPQHVLGVFADEATRTLWACLNSFDAKGPPAELRAIDIGTGKTKRRYPLPTAGAFCNDIAIDSNATVYATDTSNMEIVRLKKGATALEVWAGGGAFGIKGGVLDGIAILGDRAYVNTLGTGKLFRVAIEQSGAAGVVTELTLSRPIEGPDGMRSIGADVLLVEGGAGRLSRAEFAGDRVELTTVKDGFVDGPTAVTVVDHTAYVLEAQLKAMDQRAGLTPKPFRATAVQLQED